MVTTTLGEVAVFHEEGGGGMGAQSGAFGWQRYFFP